MSSIRFELEAESRADKGKGASRRLRHANRVPAIIYGGGENAASITLEHNKVMTALSHEAFYSHILDLKVGGASEKVILKAVQRHPARPRILHMDFQRVRSDQKLHMHVPLHFKGEEKAPGIAAGGIFNHLMVEVEVVCLPANLPEFINVDVSRMALNDSIHLTELVLPEGVQLTALAHGAEDHDQAVVSIHMPRIEVEEEPVAEATEETAAAEGAATEAAAGAESGGKKAAAEAGDQKEKGAKKAESADHKGGKKEG